jgi:acyl-CoA synthetase (NDP forming)
MGIFGAKAKLVGLMPSIIPKKGGISFISQSGNIGVQILLSGSSQGIGFNKFVSSGNEADLHCEDYLEYFGEDPETHVIIAYIEGIKDGRKFIDVAEKVTKRKPIIVFKAGKTRAGGRAARSHTGALAGSREIHNAVFKQAGIIQASTTSEILDLAAAFSNLPLPKGNRTAIITAGGGWGVVCADACVDSGLDIVDLPEDVIREFDNYLPSYWSRNNPIDLVASSIIQEDPRYLEVLIKCEEIDGIIAMGFRIGPSKIREFMDRYNKPIISVFAGSDEVIVTDERTVSYNTPERAANVLYRMYEYERLSKRD